MSFRVRERRHHPGMASGYLHSPVSRAEYAPCVRLLLHGLLLTALTLPSALAAPRTACPPEPKESPAKEAEWNRYLSQLAGLAQKLPRKPDERLLVPVAGVRREQIADTWGAPRTDDRSHAGQDVFAKKGTPVLSATDGIVWRIGTSERGGRWVYVLGAGGRRYYYAHLATVASGLKEGQRVTARTVLGTVGDSGNADGTPPHLHFAMYGPYDPKASCRFLALDPFALFADRN